LKRIYIDTCVWCRPFDEPSLRISAERRAFLKILRKVYSGKFDVVGSVFLDIEVEMIEGEEKKEAVKDSMHKVISEKIECISGRILSKKEEIKRLGLKDMDAYHLACAIEGRAKYFISVDDKILRKGREIEKRCKIKMCNPIEFLRRERNGNQG
jgi:predicted nucleic acid-binding protein